MSEELIDLGPQRLSVSSELGSDFALVLEGRARVEEGQEKLVEAVRRQVSENPRTQIIGTRLTEESTLPDVVASLNRQVGLPPDSKLRHIGDRLVGREDDFLLLVLGIDRITDREKKRLKKGLKGLRIKTIFG